jgi:hypothetical protein
VNLLLLAIAFRVWSGSALAAFLRLMAAIATFSLEMQVATWSQTGTIRSMRLVNVGIAAIAIMWHARRRARQPDVEEAEAKIARVTTALPGSRPGLPPPAAIAALAVLVTGLAIMRPVSGADPYHLHRVDLITGLGTLAYDPGALDLKVNALAGVYELLLADLRIPGMATAFVRLHGLFGLGFYLLAIAAVAPWAEVRRRWLLLVFLVIPVVFHQLVLVKNDLFGALPAFVALAWVVTRGPAMTLREIGAAAALVGFSVGIKIASAPFALVVTLFVLFDHRSWRAAGGAVCGGLAGATAGGLLFTLAANQALYGGAMQPYLALGNRHETLQDATSGVVRFVVSLGDLGLVTPRVWPGRGGWGSTLGLPMAWALVVLALRLRDRLVRRALLAGATCFAAFAASYPDADIAHRMVIAPGLLLILTAIASVDGDDRKDLWLRRALALILVLSALQIGRSALLYLRT